MFVDSVNFIVNTCDMNIYIYIYIYIRYVCISLSSAEISSTITPVVNFIPSKFSSLPQRVLKIVLHNALNTYRELRRF